MKIVHSTEYIYLMGSVINDRKMKNNDNTRVEILKKRRCFKPTYGYFLWRRKENASVMVHYSTFKPTIE